MTDLIIIPIFNKHTTLFQGPTVFLSDNCYIEKITDEEHSAFFRDANSSIKDSLDLNNTKCIKIKNHSITEDNIRNLRTKITFSLNLFSDDFPIVTSWCGHLNGDKKLKLKKIFEFESLAAFNKIRNNHFRILNSTKRSTIIQFLDIINKAITNNEQAIFTLEKYNSSSLRDDFLDKLLDATICFESMTPGNTELVYRLSQNISFIVGSNPIERLIIFEKMKTLYDVRSKLVHGDLNETAKKKINEVKVDWKIYEKYLRSTVTYYLLFLSQYKKKDWEQHIKELVIGTKNKIV
jgi:hypothetical protein